MCGSLGEFLNLSISNILWPKGKENFSSFIKSVSDCGYDGVELALNCIWNEPVLASKDEIKSIKDLLDLHRLKISALHSITYTRLDLEFFDTVNTRKELVDYIKKYIDIADSLNCKNIVFGSPSSRKRHGKSISECNEIFSKVLHEIDSYSNGRVIFNLEPLSKENCEYINTMMEAQLLIFDLNLSSIGIQLDIRNCIENGETVDNFKEVQSKFHHCQVGNPGLTIPGGVYLDTHKGFSNALKEINYQGFIAGEILCKSQEQPLNILKDSFLALNNIYG